MGLVSAHPLMAAEKLRKQIAWEAARLMYLRQESEYMRAKLKAARRISAFDGSSSGFTQPRQIRRAALSLARMYSDSCRRYISLAAFQAICFRSFSAAIRNVRRNQAHQCGAGHEGML